MSDFVVSYDGIDIDSIEIAAKLGLHPRELDSKDTQYKLGFITNWAKKKANTDYSFKDMISLAMAKLGIDANLTSLWLKIKTEDEYEEVMKQVAERQKAREIPEWLKEEEQPAEQMDYGQLVNKAVTEGVSNEFEPIG